MKSKMTLTASSLRIVLLVVFALTLGAGGFGFYLLQQTMNHYAEETSSLNSQASASDQNVQSLQQLKTYLENHRDDVAKVNQVVADSKQYQYQNDIVKDLTSFARQSGVTITSFTFTQAGGAATTTTPTSTASGSTTPTATSSGTNLKSTTVSVALANPIKYRNLLTFINRVEQNLTKMQISSINLTHDTSKSKDDVSSDAFIIEVYVR